MQTKVEIPRILTRYTGNVSELLIEGKTVGQLLAKLRRDYPDLYGCICNETGQLRQHINLFINDKRLNREDFGFKLSPGDIVSVFQSVSGG